MKCFRIVIFIGVLALSPWSWSRARSSALLSAKSATDNLTAQFKKSQTDLYQSETAKRKILSELYRITQKMKLMSFRQSRLTDQVLGVKSRIAKIRANVRTLRQITQSQGAMLKKRLRILYETTSNQSVLKALFSSHSSTDLDRFLMLLKIVSDRDYRLIRVYKINVSHYREELARLKRERIYLAGIQRRIQFDQKMLAQQHHRASQILAQVDAKRLRAAVRLRELESKATDPDLRTDRALLRLLQASFFEQKGHLHPPVRGNLIRQFGYFTDNHGIRIAHKGVFFNSIVGSSVSAVFAGVVRYAGWLDGYGKTIILDHGHHYYTVYAYNSQINVKVGEHVKTGQRIAKVGYHSQQLGPGLYFEVRHFAEPENPAQWLKGTGIQISTTDRLDHIER